MKRSSLKARTCAIAVLATVACVGVGAQQSTQRSGAPNADSAATKNGASTADTAPTKPGTAATAANAKLDRGDRKFVEEAANGGLMEVELGNLAQQKASSEKVKEFGARMATDHGKANDELKQLAQSKGVTVPAEPDKSHQKAADKMSKLSGAQFDREYMAHMLSDHRKDVKEFQKAAESSKDSDVKAFANDTLPTLQEHLKMAQTVNESVKAVR